MISTQQATRTATGHQVDFNGESPSLSNGETALVGAASELVSARGITRVSLSEVARHAGVSRQWLHHLYPRIDDLHLEIFLRAHASARTDLSTRAAVNDAQMLLLKMAESVSEISIAGAIIGLHALGEPSGILARCVDALNVRWFVRPLVDAGACETVGSIDTP